MNPPGSLSTADALDLAVALVTRGGGHAAAAQDGVAEQRKPGHDRLTGSVVTEVDHAVEKMLEDAVAAASPDDAFVGEEFADRPGTSGRTWYADPVDGTLNYARRLGLWSCVLSAWRGEDPELVAVWGDGRVWSASRGGGAFLDGRRLHLDGETEPGGLVSCTGPLVTAVEAAGFLPRVVDSSAAQVCQVADGRAVGSVRRHGDRRDLHGPALLVAEAGGTVTAADGGAWDGASRGLVLAHPGAHASLLALL